MLTSTFRGMIAHKLRLVLTTASISLGVAFLAGTLILTDTMNLAFEQLFGKVSSGTDAVVRTEASYTQSSGVGTNRPPIAASVLDDVLDVDGVRTAEGFVTGYALLTDTEGKAVLTNGGAPTMGYTMAEDETLRGEVQLRSGTAPAGPGDVVIDAASAEENDIDARLAHQGAVPGPDPGVHRRRHRRVRRREEPGRQHGGVLRRRDRAGGPRGRRPVRLHRRGRRGRRLADRPGRAHRRGRPGRHRGRRPARRSRRRTPTPSRRS